MLELASLNVSSVWESSAAAFGAVQGRSSGTVVCSAMILPEQLLKSLASGSGSGGIRPVKCVCEPP